LPFIKKIVEEVLRRGIPDGICFNVNFPMVNGEAIRGVKVCRQAKAYWEESFDERKDPHQRDYFWLSGYFQNLDKGEDTDEWALANHFVAITPIKVDFTAHHFISELQNWDLNN
jgi:5'-nucleotidase